MDSNTTKARRVLMIAFFVMLALSVVFALIVVLGALKWNEVDDGSGKFPDKSQTAAPTEDPSSEPTSGSPATPSTDTTPEPTAAPITFKDYTMVTGGDILMHMGLQDMALALGGGNKYDFSEMTKYVKSYISSHDYAVLNFEGTLAGTRIPYSSYPRLNVPDAILDSMKDIGVNMMLFSNNHAYDTDHDGLIRTMETFSSNGFDYIGARTAEDKKSYGIFNVGDVKVGMMNFTYESPPDYELDNKAAKFINGIRLELRDIPLIDSFNYNWLEDFYKEAELRIADMKENGAEIIICFMHWGDEYDNTPNEAQVKIAQKLCNLGVDAIIGGHPHVIQTADVLTSADGSRKTIVYYSLGNFLSNQNRETFSNKPERGIMTENGLLASITIRKYSTGEAQIVSTEYMPTWLMRHTENGTTIFNLIPLKEALVSEASKASYGLTKTSTGVKYAETANDYITSVVNAGAERFNNTVTLLHEDATKAQ